MNFKKIHKKNFKTFLINIICFIQAPENVQTITYMGQFKSQFKYLEKKGNHLPYKYMTLLLSSLNIKAFKQLGGSNL